MAELHETLIGRKFFEDTMPEIANQLKRIANTLEKINQEEDITNVEESDVEKTLEEKLEEMETSEEKFDFIRELLLQRFEILEEKVSLLIEFLEYEEAYTKDRLSQKRIRTVLEKIGVWKSK